MSEKHNFSDAQKETAIELYKSLDDGEFMKFVSKKDFKLNHQKAVHWQKYTEAYNIKNGDIATKSQLQGMLRRVLTKKSPGTPQ